jgi:hypothetical protein
MPLFLRNAVRKGKRSKREHWHRGKTPQSQHQHRMLVGDQERTSTKRSEGCLRWQIVWCVKGLMNHPILKAATNVRLLRTHPRGRGSIKIEQGLRRQEYATLFWECNNERQSFIKGIGAWASNTTIKTPTTDVSRRPRANLHQSSPGLPPLENCLLREGLNEPPNSQRCNQCGIITHIHKGVRQY